MTKARVRVTWPQGKEWRNSPGGWQLPAACSVDLLIVTIPASKRGLFLATPGPAKIVTFRLPCGSLLIKPTDLAVSILICSNEVIMCWVSSQFQLVVDIFFFTFTPFIYLFFLWVWDFEGPFMVTALPFSEGGNHIQSIFQSEVHWLCSLLPYCPFPSVSRRT